MNLRFEPCTLTSRQITVATFSVRVKSDTVGE